MFEVFDTKDRNLIIIIICIIIIIIIIIIYIFRTIHPAYNGDLQILMNDLSTTLVESLVGSPIDENDWKTLDSEIPDDETLRKTRGISRSTLYSYFVERL
jgi:hypothetical protein